MLDNVSVTAAPKPCFGVPLGVLVALGAVVGRRGWLERPVI